MSSNCSFSLFFTSSSSFTLISSNNSFSFFFTSSNSFSTLAFSASILLFSSFHSSAFFSLSLNRL